MLRLHVRNDYVHEFVDVSLAHPICLHFGSCDMGIVTALDSPQPCAFIYACFALAPPLLLFSHSQPPSKTPYVAIPSAARTSSAPTKPT